MGLIVLEMDSSIESSRGFWINHNTNSDEMLDNGPLGTLVRYYDTPRLTSPFILIGKDKWPAVEK